MNADASVEFLRRETPKKFYGISEWPVELDDVATFVKGLEAIDFIGMVLCLRPKNNSTYRSMSVIYNASDLIANGDVTFVTIAIPLGGSEAIFTYNSETGEIRRTS